MDTPRRIALVAICLTTSLSVGCMSPYPYQQYPQAYPGGYYNQPQMIQPGQSFPSPTGELNAPTPAGSAAANPTPATDGGYNPTNDAPMFGQDSDAKKVPEYNAPSIPPKTAPGDLGPPPTNSTDAEMFDKDKTTFDSDVNPFGSIDDEPASRNVSYDEKSPAPKNLPILKLSAETEAGKSGDVELAAAEFEAPIPKSPDKDELAVPFEADSMPNPYAHDAEGYLYLRGLVSFDDRSNTWSIIYNDKPAREDEYGGVFTLANNPGLATLNENDIVHVEGHVSAEDRDEFGKPKYVVKHLSKLKPRTSP